MDAMSMLCGFLCGFIFACLAVATWKYLDRTFTDHPDVESTLILKTSKMSDAEKSSRLSMSLQGLEDLKNSRDVETKSVTFYVKGRELIEPGDSFPNKIMVQYWLDDDLEYVEEKEKYE